MYLSATNQGPTATINSAMSGRVGGGGILHIHMGDTYFGGAEYTQIKNNKQKNDSKRKTELRKDSFY